MNFIKRFFNRNTPAKETPQPPAPVDFWTWFEPQREAFQQVVRSHKKVDENFLSLVMPKLRDVNEDFACQVGMFNENTAELVVSAEGHIESFVFAEEFIASAPTIPGWLFTALSQPVHGTSLETRNYTFSTETLSFFYEEEPGYPDEIVVTIVHADLTEENKADIQQGVYLFLDNYLGELNSATLIDDLYIKGPSSSHPPLIPMTKLEEFLIWKQKEFVEKYNDRWFDNEDNFTLMNGEDQEGLPAVALFNQSLLEWDGKMANPWMTAIEVNFGPGNNGMPDTKTFARIRLLEEELETQLTPSAGCLNLGVETYKGTRTIYFACREFRESSKAVRGAIEKFAGTLTIDYSIYKDKYWRTMDKYRQNQ